MYKKSYAKSDVHTLLIRDKSSGDKSSHQLRLLQKIGLLDNIGKVSIKRASAFSELVKAYSLCYNVFLENGYTTPNFLGMRIREWELCAQTATFIAKHNRNIIGLITLTPDISGLGLPTEWLFPDEIQMLRKKSKKMTEAANAAIHANFRHHSIPMEFFRCMLAHAWHTEIDSAVAVINKSHKSFYEFLFMQQIGEEKSYSDAFYDPVILMHLDCKALYTHLSIPRPGYCERDFYLRNALLLDNPYIQRMKRWQTVAINTFITQKIGLQFRNACFNSLMNTIYYEMNFDALEQHSSNTAVQSVRV
ncbi:MAG: hypothetical protein JW904_14710 [Spirochaetales bacterium]|nr:hypothetical protein [Spirochaetales bacterium]